jgi:predicted transcriptional regulator
MSIIRTYRDDINDIRNHAIRAYREKHSLSLKEFGDLVGVQKAAVCKWEGGLRPSVEAAIRIHEITRGEVSRSMLRPDIWDDHEPAPTPPGAV